MSPKVLVSAFAALFFLAPQPGHGQSSETSRPGGSTCPAEVQALHRLVLQGTASPLLTDQVAFLRAVYRCDPATETARHGDLRGEVAPRAPGLDRTFLAAAFLRALVGRSPDMALWLDHQQGVLDGYALESVSEYYWEEDQWGGFVRSMSMRDARGNTTQQILQGSERNRWVNLSRDLYSYDGRDQVTTWTNQYWEGNRWINSGRSSWSYSYDERDRLVRQEVSYQGWDGSRWREPERSAIQFKYDARGRLTEEVQQRGTGTRWVDVWRAAYSYDAQAHLAQKVWKEEVRGKWMDVGRELYSYEAGGHLTQRLVQIRENGQWVNYAREVRSYDANGYCIDLFEQAWAGSEWANFSRYLFRYDALGREIQWTWMSNHPEDMFRWVNQWQRTKSYNALGHETQWLDETWHDETWLVLNRSTGTYDAEGRLTEWLKEVVDETRIQWYNYYKVVFAYRGGRLPGASTLVSQKAGVPSSYVLEGNYPNPFNPETVIPFALPEASPVTVGVYDLQGREQARLVDGVFPAGRHEVKWDASGLPTGLYLVRMVAAGKTFARTIVLMK